MRTAFALVMLVMRTASLRLAYKTYNDETPCMITSKSGDGVGHQLEAKLSCIATAKELGMKYVGTPFLGATTKDLGPHAGKQLGKSFNDFMGLNKVFANTADLGSFQEKAMGRKELREWLRELAKDPSKCEHDGHRVYKVDECWDYMYGDAKWPKVWYDVLPEVQKAYFQNSGPKPVVFAAEKTPHTKVSIHIRRGDTGGKQLDDQYYEEVITELRKELTKDGKTPKFYIDTDEQKDGLKAMKQRLLAPDVVLAPRDTDVHEVLHRMITADVLVMSDSSLSISAALIGNHSLAIVPGCAPQGMRKLRALPTWRSHKCDKNHLKDKAIDNQAKKLNPYLDEIVDHKTATENEENTEQVRSSKMQESCEALHQPSAENYTLWKPDTTYFSQYGQDEKLESLLPSKGFFIESGAADGETNSNTLYYEMKGWNGLLVEPNPSTFEKLMKKHRKAHAYNGALSITGDYGTMTLEIGDCAGYHGDGECSKVSFAKRPKRKVEIEVAPLQALLACLHRSTVDLWSLDVEGVEGKILETFPFQKIEVGVMLIEMDKNDENNKLITETMTKNGFQVCGKINIDQVFVNPKYYTKRGLKTPKDC